MTGEEPSQLKNDRNTINSSSPHYIHAFEYPRQMHVNDVLTNINYGGWLQEIKNFLFAKNKMSFVDGSIKKLDETSDQYMEWMRCDIMIKGWLATSMEKDIRSSFKYASTAAKMWADLKERFDKESAPHAYELKQTLNIMSQEGTTVSTYYTKVR